MTHRLFLACLFAQLTLAAAALGLEGANAAVSNAVRNACEKKANAVTPPLRAGEREAYIANCIADAAPMPGKTKKKH